MDLKHFFHVFKLFRPEKKRYIVSWITYDVLRG